MALGKFEVRGVFRTTVSHTAIECTEESSEHSNLVLGGNCAGCAYKWLSSLPFYHLYRKEDDLLKVELRIANTVEWYKSIIKGVWDTEGEEWRGYTVEFFGPKVGAPKDYPFWHIPDEQEPDLVIPLLRTRICYEPQIEETPIFLELRYREFRVATAIRWMDEDAVISNQDLKPLLRARDRWFELPSASLLDLDSKKHIELVRGFMKAARRLSESGEPFTIRNLCGAYGKIKGYKSRTSWYVFLKELGPERGRVVSSAVRDQYEEAQRASQRARKRPPKPS